MEEKAGYQYRDDMTPVRATALRAARMERREPMRTPRGSHKNQERAGKPPHLEPFAVGVRAEQAGS